MRLSVYLPSAKQVADVITLGRLFLGFVIAGLGIAVGTDALPLAALLLMLNWTGDAFDGALARRSRRAHHTWVGDLDIEIDVAVSAGLAVYLVGAGYLTGWGLGLYLALWLAITWRMGPARSLLMLFQAPIYGYFIYTALREAPLAGGLVVGWIVLAIIFTWPRFPRMVVPGFLAGMRRLGKKEKEDHQE